MCSARQAQLAAPAAVDVDHGCPHLSNQGQWPAAASGRSRRSSRCAARCVSERSAAGGGAAGGGCGSQGCGGNDAGGGWAAGPGTDGTSVRVPSLQVVGPRRHSTQGGLGGAAQHERGEAAAGAGWLKAECPTACWRGALNGHSFFSSFAQLLHPPTHLCPPSTSCRATACPARPPGCCRRWRSGCAARRGSACSTLMSSCPCTCTAAACTPPARQQKQPLPPQPSAAAAWRQWRQRLLRRWRLVQHSASMAVALSCRQQPASRQRRRSR